jgi:hypothetical protein
MGKIQWTKRLPKVPKKLPKHGAIRIRPISFHMDKTTDKYVVSGGGHKAVITGSRSRALEVAGARVKVRQKKLKEWSKLRSRYSYYLAQRGIDEKAARILAIRPAYVRKEFRQVKKLHGIRHAVSFLKGKHGF